jgi:hypothetical protein
MRPKLPPSLFTNHTQKLHALTATTSQIVQNNRTRRATQPPSNATSSLPCTSDTPIVTLHEFNSATFPSMDELDRHLSPGHPAERWKKMTRGAVRPWLALSTTHQHRTPTRRDVNSKIPDATLAFKFHHQRFLSANQTPHFHCVRLSALEVV